MLNIEQKEVVDDLNNNIFLLAGAGSGKTRVIVEKIKKLVDRGVDASDILCITFTVKATNEMIDRLKGIYADIYTFHSYCYHVISNGNELKIFNEKTLFTEKDLLEISKYKNSLYETKKPKKYDAYKKYLDFNQMYDFDDLIIDALKLNKHKSYKYIFIDEFQDTNPLQFELIKQFKKSDTLIFAVGDPDQSIYKFRGAKVELIEKFINFFDAKVYRLVQNYRSNESIINTANNLIKNNINRFKKRLITNNKDKGLFELFVIDKDKMINNIINFIKLNKLFNAAILFRNHAQVYKLKQALKRAYLFDVCFYSFHESKGLEFDTVIIIGAEILPFNKENTFIQKEEERRLLFVAITRAKNNLIIYTTKQTKMLDELRIKYKYLT